MKKPALWYSWKIRAKVFLINLAVLAGFLGLGYAVELLLGNERHFILIIAAVVSFPVTFVLLKKFIKVDPEVIKELSGTD